MENLAQLIAGLLGLAVFAFLITTVVYLGSWFMRHKITGAQFWGMFGVTCVIFLILMFIGESLD